MTRAGPLQPLSSFVAGLRQQSTKSPGSRASCSPAMRVLDCNALSILCCAVSLAHGRHCNLANAVIVPGVAGHTARGIVELRFTG